jgi:hypothetical protein
MKKNYSIGRDESCDIVIYDATNVVSRKHAVLRVDGKRFYLTDQSTNGTYRNGVRLTPYVEYPVCPKDEISFGNAVIFDWSVLPELQKKTGPVWLYVFLPIAILLLAGGIYYFWPRTQAPAPEQTDNSDVPADSLAEASPADTPQKDSLVVLENVLAPKKSAKKTVKKEVKEASSNSSNKPFEDYKDSDDEILQDAL